ncbi:MAG: transposase [Candidatus Cybelea sp.]
MIKDSTKARPRKARGNPSPRTASTNLRSTALGAIGIDIGDHFSYVCILDSDGAPCGEERIRTSDVGFRQYFEGLRPSQVALEAGTHWGWVSRLLETHGHIVVVANARELRKIHQSDHKNDRADARILARMVRLDPQLLSPTLPA